MEENKLPRIKDVPVEKRHQLFLDKLNRCSKIFDFKPFKGLFMSRKSLYDVRESGVAPQVTRDLINNICEKDEQLEEMKDYVLTVESLPDDAVCKIMKMLQANLYRPYPSPTAVILAETRVDLYDMVDKRPLVEGAWVHLRYVYEFLQAVVDAGLLRDEQIDDKFIHWFFRNAVLADDCRESGFVADLLPSFWAKFPQKRLQIWRTVRNNLTRFVCSREDCIPNAVGNLLQFTSDRIAEWPDLLLEEHTHFLRLVLIPMHKIKSYPYFCHWLEICLVRFMGKDSSLVNLMFEGILSGDPTPSTSEPCLLDELKSLIGFSTVQEINQSNAQLLFGRIAKGLRGSEKEVQKKALDIVSWQIFLGLAKMHKEVSFPVLTSALKDAVEFEGESSSRRKSSVPILAKHMLEKLYNVEKDPSWKIEDKREIKRRRL